MDGENKGQPYFLMDDLGGKPTIFGKKHLGFSLTLKHITKLLFFEAGPNLCGSVPRTLMGRKILRG